MYSITIFKFGPILMHRSGPIHSAITHLMPYWALTHHHHFHWVFLDRYLLYSIYVPYTCLLLLCTVLAAPALGCFLSISNCWHWISQLHGTQATIQPHDPTTTPLLLRVCGHKVSFCSSMYNGAKRVARATLFALFVISLLMYYPSFFLLMSHCSL